jgi:hypothetical protein
MMGSLFYMIIIGPIYFIFLYSIKYLCKCNCSKKCFDCIKRKINEYDRPFLLGFYSSWFLPLNIMASLNAFNVMHDGLHSEFLIITISNYTSYLVVIGMPFSILFITVPLFWRKKPYRLELKEVEVSMFDIIWYSKKQSI